MNRRHSNCGNPVRALISHQGCIPIYREPFFRELKKISEFNYVVFYGDPPRKTDYIIHSGPFEFKTEFIKNNEIEIIGKSLIWQPTVFRFIRDYDIAILGEEIKYISHIAVILIAKILGRPVLLWGFGFRNTDRDEGKERSIRRIMHWFSAKVRAILLKMIDGYLVYTDSGIEPLVKAGMDRRFVRAVYNTVDIEKEQSLRNQVQSINDSELRDDFGIDANIPVLLYFGRFLPAKHVDRLIAYAVHRRRMAKPIGLVIFGSGREKDKLLAAAEGVPNIVFRAPDELALAKALRLSSAVVIPGFIGLAITHAFAHGVPMITRENQGHSPEVDYLKPGENGLMLPEDDEAFFGGLNAFLDDAELQTRLRRGAEEAARELSLSRTAVAFDALVREVIESKRER